MIWINLSFSFWTFASLFIFIFGSIDCLKVVNDFNLSEHFIKRGENGESFKDLIFTKRSDYGHLIKRTNTPSRISPISSPRQTPPPSPRYIEVSSSPKAKGSTFTPKIEQDTNQPVKQTEGSIVKTSNKPNHLFLVDRRVYEYGKGVLGKIGADGSVIPFSLKRPSSPSSPLSSGARGEAFIQGTTFHDTEKGRVIAYNYRTKDGGRNLHGTKTQHLVSPTKKDIRNTTREDAYLPKSGSKSPGRN